MKTAKIGAIFLISVLALAGVGVGFAAWTDTITISGTVNTGDVDINVVGYSGTWVYKVYGCGAPSNEIIIDYEGLGLAYWEAYYSDCTVELISYSEAKQALDTDDEPIDDAIAIIYDNLFPCIDFKVDFLLHYDGSIPAKIKVANPVFTGDDAEFFNTLIWTLPDNPPENSYCYGEMWTSDVYGNKVDVIPDLEGYQLHYCDYILIVITLHLAQDNALMNMDASFTAAIEVIQWNEYNG